MGLKRYSLVLIGLLVFMLVVIGTPASAGLPAYLTQWDYGTANGQFNNPVA